MDEPARWVAKAEAAEELEISLSTLDRKIRKGEIEVVREGRRLYVRMHGPEYLSDDELPRRVIIREDELEADRAGIGAERIGVGAGTERGQGGGIRQQAGV